MNNNPVDVDLLITGDEKLTFTCPQCGGTYIDEVMVGVVQWSELHSISIGQSEYPEIEYDDTSYDGGEIECYACAKCGRTLADTLDELIEFLRSQKNANRNNGEG